VGAAGLRWRIPDPSRRPEPKIGFVSPRPFAGPVWHNSFSARYLPSLTPAANWVCFARLVPAGAVPTAAPALVHTCLWAELALFGTSHFKHLQNWVRFARFAPATALPACPRGQIGFVLHISPSGPGRRVKLGSFCTIRWPNWVRFARSARRARGGRPQVVSRRGSVLNPQSAIRNRKIGFVSHDWVRRRPSPGAHWLCFARLVLQIGFVPHNSLQPRPCLLVRGGQIGFVLHVSSPADPSGAAAAMESWNNGMVE